MSLQVLILCGGFGTRLKSMVSDVPKPLAPISGRPFLTYLLEHIKKCGFHDICLLTGYMSEIVENTYRNGDSLGLNISYSVEETPLGTGGAIAKVVKRFPDKSHFLVLNGDTFFNIDLNQFAQEASQNRSHIATKRVAPNDRYGSIAVNSEGIVSSFREKSLKDFTGIINAGVYLIPQEIIRNISDSNHSLEEVDFQNWARNGQLKASEFIGEFIDIGIPEDYENAQKLIPKWANT